MKKGAILISGLFILVCGLLFITQAAMADLITNYTGHTAMWDNANVGGTNTVQDGVINYAVFENGQTNWVDDIIGLYFHQGTANVGADSGDLDTTAPYLYLYQAVNTTTTSSMADSHINSVTVAYQKIPGQAFPGANSITSWGYFTFDAGSGDTGDAVVFTDNGVIVQDGNNLGNKDNEPDATGGPSTKKPSPETGLSVIGFAQLDTGIIAAEVQKISDMYAGSIKENMSGNISPGMTGTIFGFTSIIPPTWGNGTLQNGVMAQNQVPTPTPVVPEPSTMLLLVFGFFGLGGAGMLKRKKVD